MIMKNRYYPLVPLIRIGKRFSLFIIVLFTMMNLPGLTFAQSNFHINGKITDQKTKSSLPGVNILVKGTTIGASTDVNGEYSLDVPNSNDTLVVSYIGYQTQIIPINGRHTINIALVSQTISGQEVVVVGYGEQKKTSLTSSVADVNMQNVKKSNVPDVRQAIQGISPGVTLVQNSAEPGNKNFTIYIRGINTIGSTQPLVIVDGIQQNLSDLDPDNVKSISILKGASATAIYGSRGANGVILVTTKSPEKGKLQVSYDGYYGIERIDNKPPVLGTRESLQLWNVGFENQPNGHAHYTDQQIEQWANATGNDIYKYPPQSIMWDVLFKDAPTQHHTLSFTGGTKNIQSLLSLSYNDEGGILDNSSGKRYEVDFNNDFKVSKNIDVTSKLTYRNNINKMPMQLTGAPSVYFDLWHWTEFTYPQFPDGTFGLSNVNTNPVMLADMSGWRNNVSDYAVAIVNANVNLSKNLTYIMQFGGHVNLQSNKNYANNYQEVDYFTKKLQFDSGYNNSNDYSSRDTRWTWRNLLKYSVSLNKSQINVLAGYEQISHDNSSFSAYREQFYNNDVVALNGGSQNNWSNGGDLSQTRLRSMFGRIHYAYNDKYIIEANARYDGSSKFNGSNNQFGFFPSFSAAWRLSRENFWNPLRKYVNEFKLRGSWGKAGNNTVANYTFYPSLNGTTYDFGGNLVDGYAKTDVANPDLTWETTTQTDIGVDAEFLDSKFGVTFDYYKKSTTGILLTLPIPATVGLNPAPQNAGQVDNDGWELSITHKNTVSRDFRYSLTANLANNHNKVISLAGTGPYFQAGGFQVIQTGYPIDSFWGYKALGYFKSQQEIDNYPTFAGKNNTFPGDLKYADLNGDGKITADDRTVIGDPFPHYTFGLNGNFYYKSFDLSFFIQGVGKMQYQLDGPPILDGMFNGLILKVGGDYWTPKNTNARFPRPQKNSHKNYERSSWWTINAAYARLQNAQIGYTLPTNIVHKLGIQRLRVYVSGVNLITLSKALKFGEGPENPANNNANGYYPGTKSYSMGINLNF